MSLSSSLPCTKLLCAVYALILVQSCSYFSRARCTYCICICLCLYSFVVATCGGRRTFSVRAIKSDSGFSISLRMECTSCACDRAMASVSPRTFSSAWRIGLRQQDVRHLPRLVPTECRLGQLAQPFGILLLNVRAA